MTRTVVAVYNNFSEANKVVQELVDAGFDRADISIMANDANNRYSRYLTDSDTVINDEDVDAGEGASFGALVGGLTGLVVGLGSLAIPGIGPVLAAGPLAMALGGAIGAAAGAATGGITASLVDMGVDETDAGYYAESVRRGGTMVVVKTRDENADTVSTIMRGGNPVDIERTVEAWRTEGWKGYDETSEPYPYDRLAAENTFYAPDTIDGGMIRTYYWESDIDRPM